MRHLWVMALCGLVSCGGAGLPTQKSNSGQIKVTMDGDVPVFDWKPCTSFGLKKCGADEYKVVGVSIGAPANCKKAPLAEHWRARSRSPASLDIGRAGARSSTCPA